MSNAICLDHGLLKTSEQVSHSSLQDTRLQHQRRESFLSKDFHSFLPHTIETKHKIIGTGCRSASCLCGLLTICRRWSRFGEKNEETSHQLSWIDPNTLVIRILWDKKKCPTEQRVIVVTTYTSGQLPFSRSSQFRTRLIGRSTSNYSPGFSDLLSVIEGSSGHVVKSDAWSKRLQHHRGTSAVIVGISGPRITLPWAKAWRRLQNWT